MNIVTAVPCYGPTEPDHNRALRVAIMHAANNGHKFVGDSSPNREGWTAARNHIVQSVINDTASYPDENTVIFWCDSDVILPHDAITRLANHGKDFVTGIYFQRHPPHNPLIATFNGKAFNWLMKWPANVLAPIDGSGFGCILTSLRMLRAMDAPWFEFKQYSEDFDFCLNAKKKGFQLYMDTGVLCGHLRDPEPVTFEDFKAAAPEFYGGPNGTGLERPPGNLVILGGGSKAEREESLSEA